MGQVELYFDPQYLRHFLLVRLAGQTDPFIKIFRYIRTVRPHQSIPKLFPLYLMEFLYTLGKNCRYNGLVIFILIGLVGHFPGGGVLPYMCYIGMCAPKGMVFQPFWS